MKDTNSNLASEGYLLERSDLDMSWAKDGQKEEDLKLKEKESDISSTIPDMIDEDLSEGNDLSHVRNYAEQEKRLDNLNIDLSDDEIVEKPLEVELNFNRFPQEEKNGRLQLLDYFNEHSKRNEESLNSDHKVNVYELSKTLAAFVLMLEKDNKTQFSPEHIEARAKELSKYLLLEKLSPEFVKTLLCHSGAREFIDFYKSRLISMYKVSSTAKYEKYTYDLRYNYKLNLNANRKISVALSNLNNTLNFKKKSKEDKNKKDFEIAKANYDLMVAIDESMKGKKSLRNSVAEQAAFDDTLRVLNLITTFSPKCKNVSQKLVDRINEVRGSKNKFHKDHVDLKYYDFKNAKLYSDNITQYYTEDELELTRNLCILTMVNFIDKRIDDTQRIKLAKHASAVDIMKRFEHMKYGYSFQDPVNDVINATKTVSDELNKLLIEEPRLTDDEKMVVGFIKNTLDCIVSKSGIGKRLKDNPIHKKTIDILFKQLTFKSAKLNVTRGYDETEYKLIVKTIKNKDNKSYNWKQALSGLANTHFMPMMRSAIELVNTLYYYDLNGDAGVDNIITAYQNYYDNMVNWITVDQNYYKKNLEKYFNKQMDFENIKGGNSSFLKLDTEIRIKLLKKGYLVSDLPYFSDYCNTLRQIQNAVKRAEKYEGDQAIKLKASYQLIHEKMEKCWQLMMKNDPLTPESRAYNLKAIMRCYKDCNDIIDFHFKNPNIDEIRVFKDMFTDLQNQVKARLREPLRPIDELRLGSDIKDMYDALNNPTIDPGNVRSSSAFRTMKADLKKLKLVNRETDPEKYEILKAKAIDSIKIYIDYKNNQLHENGGKHKRSALESRRVIMANAIYEGLRNIDKRDRLERARENQCIFIYRITTVEFANEYVRTFDSFYKCFTGLKGKLQNLNELMTEEQRRKYNKVNESLSNAIYVLNGNDSTHEDILNALNNIVTAATKAAPPLPKVITNIKEDISAYILSYEQLRRKFDHFVDEDGRTLENKTPDELARIKSRLVIIINYVRTFDSFYKCFTGLKGKLQNLNELMTEEQRRKYNKVNESLSNAIYVLNGNDSTHEDILNALNNIVTAATKAAPPLPKVITNIKEDISAYILSYEQLRRQFDHFVDEDGRTLENITPDELARIKSRLVNIINKESEENAAQIISSKESEENAAQIISSDDNDLKAQIEAEFNEVYQKSKKQWDLKEIMLKKNPSFVKKYDVHQKLDYYAVIQQNKDSEAMAKDYVALTFMDNIFIKSDYTLDQIKALLDAGEFERRVYNISHSHIFKAMVRNHPDSCFSKWENLEQRANEIVDICQGKINNLLRQSGVKKPSELIEKTKPNNRLEVAATYMTNAILISPFGRSIVESMVADETINANFNANSDAVINLMRNHITEFINEKINEGKEITKIPFDTVMQRVACRKLVNELSRNAQQFYNVVQGNENRIRAGQSSNVTEDDLENIRRPDENNSLLDFDIEEGDVEEEDDIEKILKDTNRKKSKEDIKSNRSNKSYKSGKRNGTESDSDSGSENSGSSKSSDSISKKSRGVKSDSQSEARNELKLDSKSETSESVKEESKSVVNKIRKKM